MEYSNINLNGKWHFQFGKPRPLQYQYDIVVPALVDMASPQFEWQSEKYFWYMTEFEIGDVRPDNKVFLKLEQIQFGTLVYLNDKKVGGDIPCYTCQEFDISEFVDPKSVNKLEIRVGSKETLPEHSAVGNDFEKPSFIPGIWGDVFIHIYGKARMTWCRILPDIWQNKVQIHNEIQSFGKDQSLLLLYKIQEKRTKKIIVEGNHAFIIKNNTSVFDIDAVIDNAHLWSPEDPFLYELVIELEHEGNVSYIKIISFGMREFKIQDGHFYLNGKRRVLMGSNIAFHRLLSDKERGLLPWDDEWIKKVLVDIPKAHNMFFFRIHLGHAYNRWYDIADEQGIMLQDEWMFWTSTGSERQIEKEFSAWIKENCNHPSIVLWDPLNESADEYITEKLVPKLKALDPSRPWEQADFVDDHPYIYSLGPVLNKDKFGFSRSIEALQKSPMPTMVNEYVWWWLDKDDNPSELTKMVLERWLGKDYSQDELIARQAFLVVELTELWRRLDLDAILPFIYLSVGEGATGHWFSGPLAELCAKPVVNALKYTFAPVGISIELWDRHFMVAEKREIRVFLFNDTEREQHIRARLLFKKDEERIYVWEYDYTMEAAQHKPVQVLVDFPESAGSYILSAELRDVSGKFLAGSEKPLFVFGPTYQPDWKKLQEFTLLDADTELFEFFKHHAVEPGIFQDSIPDTRVLFVNRPDDKSVQFKWREQIERFVRNGGVMIIQEPEFGVEEEMELSIFKDVAITIIRRLDEDQGGYDSYVFPENREHPVWAGIDREHLQMFNGGFGGEMVSQHTVRPTVPFNTVASCHLNLKIPALMEIPYGKGWIIISRIQLHERLSQNSTQKDLYDRRYDPVVEKYLYNLIQAYVAQSEYHQQIRDELVKQQNYVARIRASSGHIYDAFDNNPDTSWSCKDSNKQWIWFDISNPQAVHKIWIQWGVEFSKEYAISVSIDNKAWFEVFRESNSNGGRYKIQMGGVEARYIKIDLVRPNTPKGYLIRKIEWE